MRYLVGLVCVLALAFTGCSETAGTGGAKIGDQFPAIDTLTLMLNRVYDNGDQRGDEQYTRPSGHARVAAGLRSGRVASPCDPEGDGPARKCRTGRFLPHQ
jgi:hypothetical protein